MGNYVCPSCGTTVRMNAFVKEGSCPECGQLIQLSVVDTFKETKKATETGIALGIKALKIFFAFILAPLVCIVVGIAVLVQKNIKWGIVYLATGVIAIASTAICISLDSAWPLFFSATLFGSWIATFILVYKLLFKNKA